MSRLNETVFSKRKYDNCKVEMHLGRTAGINEIANANMAVQKVIDFKLG